MKALQTNVFFGIIKYYRNNLQIKTWIQKQEILVTISHLADKQESLSYDREEIFKIFCFFLKLNQIFSQAALH